MKPLFTWLRSLVPVAIPVAVTLWIGFAVMLVVAWLLGTFVPIRSASDLAYRGLVVILLPPIGGVLCGICTDVCDRAGSWRKRYKR